MKKPLIYMLATFFVLIISALLVYKYLINKERAFNVADIKIMLDKGALIVYKKEIIWQNQEGVLVGKIDYQQFASSITFYLSKKYISVINILDGTPNRKSTIPCLNIVHLFPKEEIKEIIRTILVNQNKSASVSHLKIKDNMFVEYHQKSLQGGKTELYCKLYYV